MARTYEQIDEHMREWIARQPMFFVATAPLAQDGHLNVSPKGPGGSLRVLGPGTASPTSTVVGSSTKRRSPTCARTGASSFMFCAFEGPPRIVRLHGQAEIVLADDPRYEPLIAEAAFAEEATVPKTAARDRARRGHADQTARAATACR